MKKIISVILKFTFCFILLFICSTKVKAEDIDLISIDGKIFIKKGDNLIKTEYTGEVSDDIKARVLEGMEQWHGYYNPRAFQYRITFVDKNGTKLGKSVDYYVGDGIFSGGTYYTTSKFDLNGYDNLEQSKQTIKKLELTDSYGNTPDNNDDIVNLLKYKIITNSKLLDTLMNNATDDIDSFKAKINESNLFVTIEKIEQIEFTIFKTRNATRSEAETICSNYDLDGRDWVNCASYGMSISEHTLERINGTSSELALVIDHYYNNRSRECYQNDCVSFIRNGVFINDLGLRLRIEDSNVRDLESWGFAKKIYSTTSDSNSPFATKFIHVGRSDYGYNLNVVRVYTGENLIPCVRSNYWLFNRDWNYAEGFCCEVGEIYNEDTKKCITPKDDPNSYEYRATVTGTSCDSNGQIRFNTLSGCKNKETGESSVKPNCVYKNEKYKIEGAEVYCYDEVTVNLNKIATNFSKTIKAGAIVPITSLPTATVTKTCFGKTEKILNTVLDTSSIYSLSNITLGIGNITFEPNMKSFTIMRKDIYGQGQTDWGDKYYYGQVRATISYSGGSYLNKWVNIKTYLGSGNSTISETDEQYIDTYHNYNVTIPISTKPGQYETSVTMDTTASNSLVSKFSELARGYTSKYSLLADDKVVDCNINLQDTISNSNMYESIERTYRKYGVTADCTETICTLKGSIPSTSGITKSGCEKLGGVPSGQKVVVRGIKSTVDVGQCPITYNVDNELTTCITNCTDGGDDYYKDEELLNKLVFRPIMLSNPFPGISGTGRTTNSNLWDEEKITTYIDNRQNVYSKEPLYSITLTPSVIQTIRNYNSKNAYDDFTLSCDNGKYCISNFLRDNNLLNSKSQCLNSFKLCTYGRGD